MKFIYIASPYTKGDPVVNVRESLRYAETLIQLDFVPFCPLLYHLWHLIDPKPYEFWTKLDMEWIARCDALVRFPGESLGADAEVEEARRLGKPVFFSINKLLEAARGNESLRNEMLHASTCDARTRLLS